MALQQRPGLGAATSGTHPRRNGLPPGLVHQGQPDHKIWRRVMRRKSALAVLVATCAVLPATASAMSETDCAAEWKSADGNSDGVLVGPEADRYLAYYPARAPVTPVDGRLPQQHFITACQNDIFMAKLPAPGGP